MRRILLLAALSVSLAYAPPAAAWKWGQIRQWTPPTQTLTVKNDAGVPARELARAEHAITLQARQLRHSWGTPLVRFTATGWPIILTNDATGECDGFRGCHTDGPTPRAFVEIGPSWTVRLSHETLEMIADPTLAGVEVCDPAESTYRLASVTVSDFIRRDGRPFKPMVNILRTRDGFGITTGGG